MLDSILIDGSRAFIVVRESIAGSRARSDEAARDDNPHGA
jgi:hypothetical protein